MKIVLISPKGPLYRHRGGIWRKSLRYQPLTLTTLAALIDLVNRTRYDHIVTVEDPIEYVHSNKRSLVNQR